MKLAKRGLFGDAVSSHKTARKGSTTTKERMFQRARYAPVFALLSLAFLAWPPLAHADGAVSGHVTVPSGTKVDELKVVLTPESARSGRLTVKVGKKGDFYFGIVPQGTWTLGIEGTDLV